MYCPFITLCIILSFYAAPNGVTVVIEGMEPKCKSYNLKYKMM